MPAQVSHELGVQWTRDESARQEFVSGLRAFVLGDAARLMRTVYDHKVKPSFKAEQSREPRDGPEIHRLMKKESIFRFYSRLRADAQGMVWRSVLPGISRQARELAGRSEKLSQGSVAGGTLTLDPDLQVPHNISALDVHWMPGCYHQQDFDSDVAAGAVYEQGLTVFFLGFLGDDHDDVGRSVAQFLKAAYPDFTPQSMLDVGCTVGGDTLPWGEAYPQLEIHAVDPCAPVLRYAHARAQSFGQPVHFHQMNGEDLGFPDQTFDLVWSAQVLHELPTKMLRKFLKECFRVLKPGGLMVHMELPPNKQVAPYDQFYIDWDSYYNNEPWYKTFRDMDPVDVVTHAGFQKDNYVQFAIPSLHAHGKEAVFGAARDCGAALEGNIGKLEAGVSWFTFGAWK